ncbi:MAG TPA: hypothetical protein PKD84_03915 [Propionicimonas sp.]|nr:hypothetical protein [Propionicimonas sp.]
MLAFTRWTSPLLAVAMISIALGAVAPAPTAQAATAVTMHVSPRSPMPGERFTVSGRIGTKVVRPVNLQRRSCARVNGRLSRCVWKKAARGHTTATGAYTLAASTKSTALVRVVAKAVTVGHRHYPRRVSATTRIRTVSQRASLSMPATATAGRAVTATATFTPARNHRPTQLQALIGGQWTVLGRGTETAQGTSKLSVTLTTAGTFRVRAVALGWHGAKTIASATATITVRAATTTPATDLCTGVGITGKAKVAYTNLAKPAVGQAVIDPDFGTTIRRVTDVAARWPDASVVVPAYPTIPAWNADESYLLLYVTESSQGWALFNGKTYAYIKMLDINPADVEQFYWSTTDPDLIYYVDQNSFVLTRMHVSTGVKDTIHDFRTDITSGVLKSVCAGADLVSGGSDPFFMSTDNDLIGLGCRDTSGDETTYEGFSYRISTNTIGPTQHLTAVVAQASPSGASRFLAGQSSSTVLDATSNTVKRTLAWSGEEHSDMLRNAAGDDLVAGVQYDGPSGSGTLMVANLDTGAVSTIIGESQGDPYPPTGTLVSGRAYRNPGWVALAATGNGLDSVSPDPTYLEQEVLLANVDTKQVCRVAHHRSFGYDANSSDQNYWAQPNVVMSPSGTRILFPSDWYGGATIDTYVIELPSYAG